MCVSSLLTTKSPALSAQTLAFSSIACLAACSAACLEYWSAPVSARFCAFVRFRPFVRSFMHLAIQMCASENSTLLFSANTFNTANSFFFFSFLPLCVFVCLVGCCWGLYVFCFLPHSSEPPPHKPALPACAPLRLQLLFPSPNDLRTPM